MKILFFIPPFIQLHSTNRKLSLVLHVFLLSSEGIMTDARLTWASLTTTPGQLLKLDQVSPSSHHHPSWVL